VLGGEIIPLSHQYRLSFLPHFNQISIRRFTTIDEKAVTYVEV
jgi:hypothetical protein